MVRKTIFTTLILTGLLIFTIAEKCLADTSDLPQSLYTAAGEYREARKYEEAKNAYQQIIQQYPDSPYAGRAQLGIGCTDVLSDINSGKITETQAGVNSLITGYPGHSDLPEVLYNIGKEYRWVDEYEEAKGIYQRITQLYPSDPYTSKAELGISRINTLSLIGSGDITTAQTEFNKLVTDFAGHSDLPETLYLVARKYRWSEKYDETKGLYEQILQQYPDSSHANKALLGVARVTILSDIYSGRVGNAKNGVENLITNFSGHPDLPETLYKIARRYKWSREYKEEKNVYQQIVQHCPASSYAGKAELGVKRSDILYHITSGNITAAKTAVDELTADFTGHPDLPETLYTIASRYRWERRYEEEKNLYQQIVQRYPNSVYAANAALGLAKMNIFSDINAGKLSEAWAAVNSLIAGYPDHPRLPNMLHNIAKEYKGLGKYEEAKTLYQQIIQLSPGSSITSEAQIEISMINVMSLIRPQNMAAAKAAVDKLSTDFAGRPAVPERLYWIADMYAWIEYERYEELKDIYQQIIQQYPDSPYADKAELAISRTDILSLIRSGNIAAAKTAIDKLNTDFAQNPAMPETLFLIAKTYSWLEVDKYEEARRIYQQIIQQYPDSPHTRKAQMGIAKTDILSIIASGNDSGVNTSVDNLITQYSGEPELYTVVYRIACQYHNRAVSERREGTADLGRNNFQKAAAIWERMINELPVSGATPGACYFSSDCYYRLGEYEKSANYCQKIIDDYPGYYFAPEAQFMIGQNYERFEGSGLLSKSEADLKTKAAYEQLLVKYPTYEKIEFAQLWLNRYNAKNIGENK